jgi:hypothetical protein
MNVGKSVRKAIDEWRAGDVDSSMLHACNAVDGTASQSLPQIRGSNARFTQLLRNNYPILGAMGAPDIDLIATRFPVKVERPKAVGGKPDLADVIYGIHRCSHGHGQALPAGFELINDAALDEVTTIKVAEGRIRLSDRIIFGLLAVAFESCSSRQRMMAAVPVTPITTGELSTGSKERPPPAASSAI